jgi:3-hydroxyacyl-CoA dehydrogenase
MAEVRTVALIGTGTVGTGWAVCFAAAGYHVRAYDDHAAARAALGPRVGQLAAMLQKEAPTRFDPNVIAARLTVVETLEEALAGADYVQESIAEDLPAKHALYRALEPNLPAHAVLATSSSALTPATLYRNFGFAARALVAHPFNPPYVLPLVEILGHEGTDPAAIETTRALMQAIGQAPIVLKRAVPGFIGNRLQAAVLNEAMALVADGVIDPDGIDICMRQSLALRWAFLGPFGTADLNAIDGFAGYAQRLQPTWEALGRDLSTGRPWSAEAIKAVTAARREALPLAELPDRQMRRDRTILQLRRLLAER